MKKAKVKVDSGVAIFITCFVLSVLFFGAGLWTFLNSEKTAQHTAVQEVVSLRSEVARLTTLIESNISTVSKVSRETAENRKEIQAFGSEAGILIKQEIDKLYQKLNILTDQISDTQEKQARLREEMSKKTSRIIIPAPLPVEQIKRKAKK